MIEELYKKYYEELINWCHSMTGNLYTAEELVHEASCAQCFMRIPYPR